jgi:hypothetical protein
LKNTVKLDLRQALCRLDPFGLGASLEPVWMLRPVPGWLEAYVLIYDRN